MKFLQLDFGLSLQTDMVVGVPTARGASVDVQAPAYNTEAEVVTIQNLLEEEHLVLVLSLKYV